MPGLLFWCLKYPKKTQTKKHERNSFCYILPKNCLFYCQTASILIFYIQPGNQFPDSTAEFTYQISIQKKHQNTVNKQDVSYKQNNIPNIILVVTGI